MSQFDEYFTNNDKPFAENINDALLLSNVFDYSVNIEMPTMFSNGQFLENYTSRKCGVSIVTLLSNDGLTINDNSITGTGKLVFKIYPNFNSFGNLKKISWSGDGDIRCSIQNVSGTTITSNVTNGEILNNVNLKILQEYVIVLDFNDASLTILSVDFENKNSENRYGANVKINAVDGLEEQLNQMDTAINNNSLLIEDKVDKVTGKGLSTNDYANADKNKVDNLKSVATSGNYNDLTNKPAIPTKTSDLTNDGADGTNVFVSNNDSRLSNARTPLSHSHNNITNDGKIGSASGKLITTGTGGVLQAVDTITKSKISDFPSTMPPSSHTHTKSQITDFPTSMAPTSHTHGALSNTGTLNSDITSVNKVAVTDTSNNLKTIQKVPFANLNITKANITGLGIPSTNTTYSNATTTAAGLMSSTDKTKLDGVATGATKNTIDTSLSSTSTNAVQNKVINTALSGKANSSHTHTIANVTNLQSSLDGKSDTGHTHNSWQEVTLSNQYASLYVNMDLRLAELKYYQTNVSFTSTADKTVAANIIPTEYRPVGTGVPVVIFNPKLGGNIDSVSGNFNVATTETGNKTVNAYGIWRF